jgi:nitroreductase
VDAVSCTIAPSDWDLLEWRYVLVTNSYNRQIQAQYAPLPGHDAFSGAGRQHLSLSFWLLLKFGLGGHWECPQHLAAAGS